jgi:isoleucyl-tRNA synthetase
MSKQDPNVPHQSQGIKASLNLPSTRFPMKANLPQSEPRQLAEWEAQRIYHRIQQARADARPYVLHDGPPYPTGEIHLGTGLNKILKDMIVKSKTMAGFRVPYRPGWDCHGLPIETKVEKEIGGKGRVPPAEFRRLCRDFALRFIDNHRREFKRLGIFGLWERPYFTMDPGYEAAIADAFVTFYEKGYLYRGLKPVYWCIQDGTALAEAEVEYEEHTSPSIWVKFPAVAGGPAALLGEGVDGVIWTTTPWTLPHNRALAFHPEFAYVVLETSRGNLLVAEGTVAQMVAALGLEVRGRRGPWKGAELEGLRFQHPFLKHLQVPAVLADYVTLEQGSGIVHTAPGHGAEDFLTGQRYGLEVAAPLDDEGRYLEGLPEYLGKTVFEANPHIIELLRRRGTLLGEGKLTHSYPHCWRCHSPVIFRATEQWFVNLDHPAAPGKTFRELALDEIQRVRWKPEWGRERIASMVATRPDWCISRQRFWGVPLIIFYCESCNAQLRDFAALRHVVEIFRRDGSDAWFSRPAGELLPAGVKCSCGSTQFRKEKDILDVWFESGSSHYAVLDSEDSGPWPADCYLEGPDQFRGWFQSSLLVSLGVKGRAPYELVVTHGWTLDEKGTPMSKSLGNAIYPAEICSRWGADLLRVWVAWQDYTADVSNSERIMEQLGETYRKVRNTLRFALGNLFDFDPERDALPDAQLWELDRWMLARTGELVAQCRAWYDSFDFHRIFHAIHDFCIVELSAFYFDILKDRLYTAAKFSVARRSAQTAVYRIAHALVRLLAPITVFTAEEVWQHLPKHAAEPDSVHLAMLPSAADFAVGLDDSARQRWETLLTVRDEVLKALEAARQAKTINSSLEAKVVLSAGPALDALLREQAEQLPALFIVSQVEISAAAPGAERPDALTVTVHRADGTKCERCWNYSTRVGRDARWPSLCERCAAALEENQRTGGPVPAAAAGGAAT